MWHPFRFGPAVLGILMVAVAGSWAPAGAAAKRKIGFAILLGVGDTRPTWWSGSVTGRGARVTSLDLRRRIPEDQLDGDGWKLRSRRVNLANSRSRRPLPAGSASPVSELPAPRSPPR